MNVFKGVLAVLTGLVLLTAIVVGGWLGGWWLKGANTDRQADIDRGNYGSQLAYISKVQASDKEVAAIDLQIASISDPDQKAALKAQRVAIINQGCAKASLITNPPADVGIFITVYCN